jgi:molybdopterin molybdotransferase
VIALEEAQRRLLALAKPVPAETIPLHAAAGRYAAADILAQRTQPVRDLSAMDGYAVRFADGPGPWRLIGQSAAGAAFSGALGPGDTVRIFTGAPLPQGADTVIMQEDMRAEGDIIHLSAPLDLVAGRHVRKAGEDFATGDLLVSAGEQLTPARIALAAMGGHRDVSVRRPIRVAILSTGDELVPLGAPVRNDQIPASNSVMLHALLSAPACVTTDHGIVRDDLAKLTAVFASLADADIILSTGGASVGDHDHVKPALEAAGAQIDFWKIAMRPGKPLMAGQLGQALVLGLPGNPVSAFVTAILFAQPLIAALSGAPEPLPQRHKAILGSALPAVTNRTDHIRAILTDGQATPIGMNDSAALRALARANALIVRPADRPAAQAGDEVDIIKIA